MKMIKLNFLKPLSLTTILLLIIFTFPVLSQDIFREGFIVMEARDTIKGYIKIQGNRKAPKGMLFKESYESAPTLVKNNDIKFVALTDYRFYKKVKMEDSIILSQFLVQGKVNLLSWNNGFFLEKENAFYPLKIDEEVVNDGKSSQVSSGGNLIVKKRKFIGTLKAIFSDCSVQPLSLDNTRLSETSLTKVVAEYNNCVSENPVVFKERIPNFRLEISPLLGISYTTLGITSTRGGPASVNGLTFPYLNLVDFKQITFSPGIKFNLSNPRIDDRISLSLELRYLQNSFQDRVLYPNYAYDDNDVSLSYSYLYLPIMIRREFPLGRKNTAYLNFGLLQAINLKNEYSNLRKRSKNPNAPEIVDNYPFEFSRVSINGLTGGIGYTLKITNKMKFFTEARFENRGNLVDADDVGVQIVQNVYSVISGITF